jgi:hypothetical protein
MRTVTTQSGRNPVPVIKRWPQEALITGQLGPAGAAGTHSPVASADMRDNDGLLIAPVAADVVRESATINAC